MADEQGKTRDGWDKLDSVGKLLTALLSPLIAALFGFVAAQYLQSSEATDARVRLYTELTARREEADSSLRKDMFNSIISKFLSGKSSDLRDRILNLELLAFNFHDSLDLGPLLEEVQRQLDQQTEIPRPMLQKRIDNIATKVKQRQVNVLEKSGAKKDGGLSFEELLASPNGIKVFDADLPDPMGAGSIARRHFTLTVLRDDQSLRKLLLRLEVRKQLQTEADLTFWVSLFDFPLIENVRLPDGQRCAVLLNTFDKTNAELTLVYFPGSRASIKDKPYTDEVIDDLRQLEKKSSDDNGGVAARER